MHVGGAKRDRTADLLVANEALSQLSYSPTRLTSISLKHFGGCRKSVASYAGSSQTETLLQRIEERFQVRF